MSGWGALGGQAITNQTLIIFQSWLQLRESILVCLWQETDWSMRSCLRCHLPTQSGKQAKPWIKCLNIILETCFTFSFINLAFFFFFNLVTLWTCNRRFPSFWRTPTQTRIEIQHEIINGHSVESLTKGYSVCLHSL